MDLARLFCFGFDGYDAPDSILFALDRDGVGAVILFARNCRDSDQIKALCARLRDAGGEDLWILIDQEGGRVRRITDPEIGPAAASELAFSTPDQVEEDYHDAARELLCLGIDFNLAPVADVMVTSDNPVLEGRAFGSDPSEVGLRVAAAVRGLLKAGLKCCAKHFPGLGDVTVDPHHQTTRTEASAEQFHSVHFPPFGAAIGAGASAIMTTHLWAPALDSEMLATYSSKMVRGLLREQQGFDGLVLTDDLEMKSLPDEPAIASWHAFTAGHDLLLLCHDDHHQRAALADFDQRLRGDHEARSILHQALDRQARFRQPFSHART